VRLGFVSPDAARRDYGVAIAADGTIDHAATATLRAQAAE
jgi:N-methylhydantoinase B